MLRKFLSDDTGATAIEYGLIASLISVAIILGAGGLGSALTDLWGGNNSAITQAFK